MQKMDENIKSHKKHGLYSFSRKYCFEKTTGREGRQIDLPPAFLVLDSFPVDRALSYIPKITTYLHDNTILYLQCWSKYPLKIYNL